MLHPPLAASFDFVRERVVQAPIINHFVDLMRICFLPSKLREDLPPSVHQEESITYCPSATELRRAGVKIKASDSKILLDIKFDKGVLEIPKFRVTNKTDIVYRSLIAFEQIHCCFDLYFTDYTTFLDRLIDTPEDVQVLARSGIIDNWLGSDDAVAVVFNNLGKNVCLNPSQYYYYDISRHLNSYTTTRMNRWKAILKKDYFNHPWAIISMIYAVLLLILTLLQTINSFTSSKSST